MPDLVVPRNPILLLKCQQVCEPSQEKYAQPSVMQNFGKDADKWAEIANEVKKGEWEPVYQYLWSEMPVFKHKLPDGITVRYGWSQVQYNRYKKHNYFDKELWIIALSNGGAFAVEKRCTLTDYMDSIGSNLQKWEKVSWMNVEDLEWNELTDENARLHFNQVNFGAFYMGQNPDIYSVFGKD